MLEPTTDQSASGLYVALQKNPNVKKFVRIIKKNTLRISFKLRVSFSPLHADDDHPVENKEASTRYGVKKEESKDCEEQIHCFRQGALEEEVTNTLAILHVRL